MADALATAVAVFGVLFLVFGLPSCSVSFEDQKGNVEIYKIRLLREK